MKQKKAKVWRVNVIERLQRHESEFRLFASYCSKEYDKAVVYANFLRDVGFSNRIEILITPGIPKLRGICLDFHPITEDIYELPIGTNPVFLN